MNYQEYLSLLLQLMHLNEGKLLIDDKEIFIDANSKNNYWTISTKVLQDDCLNSKNFFTYVALGENLNRNAEHCSLEFDSDQKAVYLVQEIEPLSKYYHFRHMIEAYLGLSEDWIDFLHLLAYENSSV